MIAHKIGILRFLFKTYPLHFTGVALGLAFAGFLEGITAAAFLPLISGLTDQNFSGGLVAKAMEWVQSTFLVTFTTPFLLMVIVVMMLVRALVLLAVYAQSAYAGSHVASDLRLRYLDATMKASWPYFLSQRSGAAANALGTEAMRTIYAFRSSCSFIASALQVVCYAALALFVSWQMTLAAGIGGGLVMLLLTYFVTMGRKAGSQQTDLYNDVLARLTDVLQGLKAVKAMDQTEAMLSLARRDIYLLKDAQFRAEFSDQALRILSEFLIVALVAGGLYMLSRYSSLGVPEMLFMAFVFLRLAMRLSAAQKYYHNIVSSESALHSLQGKIEAVTAHRENGTGKDPVPEISLGISFQDVGFSYGDLKIVDHLNATIPAHKFMAIYGPSGAGKTTVIDMLCGLLQPQSGKIMIDGKDLHEISLPGWRKAIGYVPQDITLFHDTIRNNMTLGSADYSDQDILDALRTAEAYDFIMAMPGGLDAMAGERGAKLSGGQRQRIALARALLKKPKLLVLDEVSSALDPETEAALLKTVKDLTKSMTIVMVTHSATARDYADIFYNIDPVVKQDIKNRA